jgi:hypothetical protein
MRFTVTAPLKGFTGKVLGIEFKGGTADLDTSNDHGRAAYAYFDRHGYRLDRVEPDEPQDGPQTPAGDDEVFDPADHKADEVLAHLDAASHEEAVRVLDAEASGKDRVTITGKREEILADKQQSTPPAGDDTQKGDQQ